MPARRFFRLTSLFRLAFGMLATGLLSVASAQDRAEIPFQFPAFGNSAAVDVDIELTAILKPVTADSAELQVTVTLPDGYYIYSMDRSFGAATSIDLTDLSGLTTSGDWKPDHEPKVVADEVLGQTVEKFFGSVTWTTMLKGPLTADLQIQGKLSGQYCGSGENGVPGECRPIYDRVFLAKLKGSIPAPTASNRSTDSAVGVTKQSSASISPKIGYGKSAKEGLIRFDVSLAPESPVIGQEVTLTVNASIQNPWHTFAVDQDPDGTGVPTRINIMTLSGLEPIGDGPVAMAAPTEEPGPDNSTLRVHYGEIAWQRKFMVTGNDITLQGEIAFQLCNDKVCLLLTKAPFELAITAVAAPMPPGPVTREISSEPAMVDSVAGPGEYGDKGLFALIIGAIAGGFLALLTPCVYPMLPVTVAFFLKQEEKKKGSSFKLAIVYSLSIIAAFTIFGVVLSAVYGASTANAVANNPWLNLIFAAIFMAFALMFFGVFEVRVPSWLLTWTAKRESTGGLVGVVFMALTFTLVSFTCTFAIVGQIAIAAQDGNLLHSLIGMLAFSTTFALPFFMLAMFPSMLGRLPRSGGWMNRVKVTIGLVELAMVLKFLSVADIGFSSNGLPVYLDRASFLIGWMAIAGVTAMYLLGMFRMAHDAPMSSVPVIQVLFAIGFVGMTGYIGAGVFAPTEPTGWVWGQIVSLAPPDFQVAASESQGGPASSRGVAIRQDDALGVVVEHHGLAFGLDFERAVRESSRSDLPLFIDFTGVNCANCRYMERDVLSQPAMIGLFGKMIRAQLYTDVMPGINDPSESDRLLKFNRMLQEQWFKDSALPGYAVVSSDGKTALSTFIGYDSSGGKDFLAFLNAGLNRWEQLKMQNVARTESGGTTPSAM